MSRAYKMDANLALVYTDYKTNNYNYGDSSFFWRQKSHLMGLAQHTEIYSLTQSDSKLGAQTHSVNPFGSSPSGWGIVGTETYHDGLQYPLF